ncbi:MAG: hypothetical protein KatS3mg104_1049 [Phycisphaerae bacterium]|nr:MAG: hypothetical protein KatS3mg104_1049 [Phycisphaerae bacterium]
MGVKEKIPSPHDSYPFPRQEWRFHPTKPQNLSEPFPQPLPATHHQTDHDTHARSDG